MIPRLPSRFGRLSSLRGGGIALAAEGSRASFLLADAPRRNPPLRFSGGFGTVSSVMGTGIAVRSSPSSCAVLLAEAPRLSLPFPWPARFGTHGRLQVRDAPFHAAPCTAAFDRADYQATREIAFESDPCFAQLSVQAMPDLSPGVTVAFEEVYDV